MRKISLIFLMLALLSGVSAYAQKSRKTSPQPAQPIQTTATASQYVYVQDDLGGGFLVINVTDGSYKAKLCDYGYSFSGTGSVKVDGCSVTFSVIQASHTITATANVCDQKAQSFVEVKQIPGVGFEGDPVFKALNDSNISDSTTECAVKVTPPAEVPSEIIIQNDADGSFLHLSTSGEYKFIDCENGVVISGRGKVTITGDMLYFEHITEAYRVLASVNLDAKEGKAAIEVFTPFKTEAGEVPAMREYIGDNNLADNIPECGAKKL
jgi:hypothetical protein